MRLQLIARDRFGNNRGAWTPWGSDGLVYGGANDTLTLSVRNSTHAICNASSATHVHIPNAAAGHGDSHCDPLISVSWEWQESCGGCYQVTFECVFARPVLRFLVLILHACNGFTGPIGRLRIRTSSLFKLTCLASTVT